MIALRPCARLLLAAVILLAASSYARASSCSEADAVFVCQPMAKVKAKFECKGKGAAKIQIEIKGALPFASFKISIKGKFVGVVTCGPDGCANVDCHGPDFCIPTIDPCDVICVGQCVGVFVCKDAKIKIEAKLKSCGQDIKVKYEEKCKKGSVSRKFELEIKGACPGESFDILINDEFVMTVTADCKGKVKLKLESGCDMPDDFPVLRCGDVITIGSNTITLG